MYALAAQIRIPKPTLCHWPDFAAVISDVRHRGCRATATVGMAALLLVPALACVTGRGTSKRHCGEGHTAGDCNRRGGHFADAQVTRCTA